MNNFLNSFRKKINLYLRYPHWKKQGAIFIHVPKAAGTSINKAIYGRTLGHYTAEEIKNKFPDLYNKSFVFSFVRNPWSRTVSAYKFAKQGRTESMGVYRPEQYQIPEFETFELFVKEWLVNQNVNTLDYIFQPQVRFLTDDNGKVIVDYVEKLESLESSVIEIEKRLGRSIKVGKVNASMFSGDYTKYYSNKELIGLVGDIYADDIKLFNYDFGGDEQ